MMSGHFNRLTPAQLERLTLVVEECAEVQQIIGKILRHGYESYHPDNTHDDNRALLEIEMGDLNFAMDLLVQTDLSTWNVRKAAIDKSQRVGQYLHHNFDVAWPSPKSGDEG
jgi:hypothetical protein